MKIHYGPAGASRPVVRVLTALALSGFFACASAEISGDVFKMGFITDLSGSLSDTDGQGGVEAIKLAIEDFGGQINGKPIRLLVADHQNRADIAATKAREWMDEQGLDLLIGGTNSSAALAMADIATRKKKPLFVIAAGTAQLTNQSCNPYTFHYAYDTVAAAKVMGAAVVKLGGDTWYFLTADYAFGKAAESDARKVITKLGGKVVGSVRFPMGTTDFSSFLLQAQASKAKILGMATSGDDTINAIKAAHEFGVTNTMKLAGMLMYINEVNTLTLDVAQGLYVSESWYWNQTEASRTWAQRFYKKMKRMPSSLQAADYSAAYQYLKAVQKLNSDDPEKVIPYLKSIKLNDMYTQNGWLRDDGTMVHDMYLYQVKSPQESKRPWDDYKLVKTIAGDEVFTTKAESQCKLWK